MISLRDYQKGIVSQVSRHYQNAVNGIVLQMPTGAGKTRTAAYIVSKYSTTGRQVLWIVHREELLMQAAMTFAEYGIEHRMICSTSSERAIKVQEFREFGKSFINPMANVIVASIQTIVRRLDKLPWLNPSQIIADEAHLSLATTWRKVLAHWPDARLLGLTATPTRLDKQSFARNEGGLYDEIVLGPTVKELMEWGNLATYKLYGPPIHLRNDVKIGKKGGDYDTKALEEELDAPVIYGDVVASYRKLSHGKPAIAFCPTVSSAQRFAEAFTAAGYRAIALDGQTDDAIRRDSLRKLGTGELDVVTSVSILVEGTDVPYATTAIMLRRTESLSLYLQAVGRVLRPHPDKEHAIIIDCVGVTHIHGYPDDDREWSLEAEGKKKRGAKNDEPDVKAQTCPHCFAIHKPADQCPNCGYDYPTRERPEMKTVDAELVEITPEQMEAMRRERMREQGKAKTVEALVAQGKSRKAAEIIIQARAEKEKLINDVIDGFNAVTKAKRQSPVQLFGVSAFDVKRLKPKQLKELKQQIDQALAA